MDEVTIFGTTVDRIVVEVAAALFCLGVAYGAIGVWRRTTSATPWRTARCLVGAGGVAIATLVAAYAGIVVFYVAGSLLPDTLLIAVWPLGIAAFAGVVWASARVLLPPLADVPEPVPRPQR